MLAHGKADRGAHALGRPRTVGAVGLLPGSATVQRTAVVRRWPDRGTGLRLHDAHHCGLGSPDRDVRHRVPDVGLPGLRLDAQGCDVRVGLKSQRYGACIALSREKPATHRDGAMHAPRVEASVVAIMARRAVTGGAMEDRAPEIFERLGGRGYVPRLRGVSATIRFDVSGAGSWRVAISHGSVTATESTAPAECVLELEEETLCRMASGKLKPLIAFMQGLVTVKGEPATALNVAPLFADAAPAHA